MDFAYPTLSEAPPSLCKIQTVVLHLGSADVAICIQVNFHIYKHKDLAHLQIIVRLKPKDYLGLPWWLRWLRICLSWGDPLEDEMATHSNILAWRIPQTEEPGGLQFMGSQRVGHD